MAAYTQLEAVANCHAMCGDGVGNLYVATYNGGITIYQYNISSDTLTDISGATFSGYQYGSGFEGGLTWWTYDDNLYMVCGQYNPINLVYCFRWNGGQSWTQVDSAAWSGILTLNPVITSSPTRLAYLYSTSGLSAVRGTADGTTWGQDLNGVSVLGYDAAQYSSLMCERYDGADIKILRNTSGSTWVELSASGIGNYDFEGTESTYSFYRARAGVNWVSRSTDWGVNKTNIADLDHHARPPTVYDLTYQVVALLSTGGGNQDQVRFWNAGTLSFDLDGTPNAGNRVMPDPVIYGAYLYVLVEHDGIYRRDVALADLAFAVSPKYEARGMDASADDTWLYVACLEGGNPVLLRLAADLSADPTRAYDPGSGDAISVVAGRRHDDWVWIAGRFAGSNKVALSDDDGASWTVEDPGTWGGRAYPPLIGPDDDGRMLIATDQDDDLHETLDNGTAWDELNTGLPFDVGDMDALDINPDELVMGRNVAGAVRVEYSPSRGRAFNDITTGTPNFETTTVIVG